LLEIGGNRGDHWRDHGRRAIYNGGPPRSELCALLRHLGFAERIRGDHYIFTREGVAEILNLQPRGGKAKAYQVKQVRGVLTAYGLAGAPEAEEASTEQGPSEGEDSIQTEEGEGG